jgi:hypothetical protein
MAAPDIMVTANAAATRTFHLVVLPSLQAQQAANYSVVSVTNTTDKGTAICAVVSGWRALPPVSDLSEPLL